MNNDKLIIEGNKPLFGDVRISGAKNAVLPLISISLLFNKGFTLNNVPNLLDTNTMIKLVNELGVKTKFSYGKITFDGFPKYTIAPENLVSKMRASFLVLAPLLAIKHKAIIPMPGGCKIGERPIDLHIKALEKLGAKTIYENNYLKAELPDKRFFADEIIFSQVSVGATECALMAATLAYGKTTIHNAAKEPEIVDLGNCLNKAGAKINGLGTNKLEIIGVNKLRPVNYTVIPDRIEAGSFAIIAAITKGKINILNLKKDDLAVFFEKLRMTNTKIEFYNDSVTVEGIPKLNSVNVETKPHPGFPTDLQAQFMSLMSIANGRSIIKENIFENRFMHVPELKKMNAKISLNKNTAIVNGVHKLSPAILRATDLRASMSLIAACLNAEGKSEVHDLSHLKRGYENFENKLSNLGANID